jgi:hypothetical protein
MNEWRGYVVRALEDIDADLKRLFECYEKCETARQNDKTEVDQKVEILSKRVNNLYLKVIGVAVAVGSLAGLIFDLAKDAIIKIIGGG